MISFLIRRLIWMALTLWVVFTVSFFLMRNVPGGPFDMERELPKEVKANLERRYNLHLPVSQQYLRELGNYMSGDLGLSYKLADYSVVEVIKEGLPISAALGMLALTFALSLGMVAGIISAVKRGALLDSLLMMVATIGIALPSFVIAGVCIIVFVFLLPVFPAAGWGSIGQLILPALCLGLPFAAYIARIVRTSMLDTLSQDYIRTARAKGLSHWGVVVRHALPGALMPVVSFLGPATAGILTGSLVIEQIFYIPGMGSHFVRAAIDRDYTLAMGLVVLYTVLLYSLNLLVDMAYAILDPRVELK